MEWNHVGNKDITSPSGHHIKVEHCTECSPKCASELQCLDPKIEGEHEQENGNGLIVV